jgi:DNA-binding NarL/FixJ family response regulator
MRVLLVDDQGLVREGLALVLDMLSPDTEVKQAATADEAKSLIKSEPFDFVFLDIDLGPSSGEAQDNLAGLSLLRELKDEGITTPVIMLSGHEDRETILQAIDSGAFGFIPKSSENSSVITQAIQVILNGGVYLPPTFRSRGGLTPPPPMRNAMSPVKPTVSVTRVGAEDLALSPRLYETAYCVAQGLSNKAIGRRMQISENSVAEYVGKIYSQLGLRGRSEFLAMLNKRGFQLAAPHTQATQEIG